MKVSKKKITPKSTLRTTLLQILDIQGGSSTTLPAGGTVDQVDQVEQKLTLIGTSRTFETGGQIENILQLFAF